MEYDFEVKYRPGTQMRHVDAMSRNPPTNTSEEGKEILYLDKEDWILAGQLTDPKLQELHRILSQTAANNKEREVQSQYELKENRIYRKTKQGPRWVVPVGMRRQVVHASHDERGHFALEKTLNRIAANYWFPNMKHYVETYISCCIPCILRKHPSGKKEGYLYPIPKPTQPFQVLHMDHLGPFPKSTKGNLHVICAIDACTKFLFLKPVKSTKTLLVTHFLDELNVTYGRPKVIITDQGSSFTSKTFAEYCRNHFIRHNKVAVATPRANGQIERLNRSILAVLMTGVLEKDRWDQQIAKAQFAINNTVNSATGKTPSQMLLGYEPRYGTDIPLKEEVQQVTGRIEDLVKTRLETLERVAELQRRQKMIFDKKRKPARIYKAGDIVVIRKMEGSTGQSRKLIPPFSQPMIIKKVLGHDRYLVTDMPNSRRRGQRKAGYERCIAADRMRPWVKPGGVSEAEETDPEE
ncbi:hypothetical protein ABEB36_013483 [Hypothenemus hampei]|uniref:RNA-directed DNA polymerase n=1 Tax=Hypothenemus hampei TaxID=57062 RepID=A0ABD1E597_HYPHA